MSVALAKAYEAGFQDQFDVLEAEPKTHRQQYSTFTKKTCDAREKLTTVCTHTHTHTHTPGLSFREMKMNWKLHYEAETQIQLSAAVWLRL
ncbi:hypothetical protein AOLI_G00225440 [Acnodon oligacanthus]